MLKKIIISTVVLIIISTVVGLNIYNKRDISTKVKAETITSGTIKSKILTNGEILPKNQKDVLFVYDVPLKVKKIFFDKFDSVKKDDRLVEFEIPKYTSTSNKNKIKDMEKSPIAGVITETNIKEAEYTDSMRAGFVITDVKNLFIVAKVQDSYLKNIKVGQSVSIISDAFEEDESFNGKITKIAPIASKSVSSSGEEITIDVEISIDSKSDKLKPGLAVECNVTTAEKTDIVLGKFEMLKQDKDNNKFVFIINKDDKTVKKVKVELGIISDMEFEILKGVSKGDLIVLDPPLTLDDGDKVNYSINEMR